MKRTLTNLIFGLGLAVASILTLVTPQLASADTTAPATDSTGSGVDVFSNCGDTGASGAQICGASKQSDFNTLMKNIIDTILIVLGMIAVIMIVIGGIRYTTSNGDSSQVKAAKDTVLYAVVGLVIAIMAFAIVNFVLASFKS